MSVAQESQNTTAAAGPTKDLTARLAQIHEAVERMRVRVHAVHAHEESLHRAAQGVQSIQTRLRPVVQLRAAQTGWTAENQLAATALIAMQRQLDMISRDGDRQPVEEQRILLDHALCRASDVLVLLGKG